MERALNVSAAINAISPAFTSNTSISAQSMQYLSSTGQSPTIADLTTLFGNANYCECRHCQSIHGPAAYLAEICEAKALNGLSQLELLCRRPDIFQLHLNCENTATKLPHIDLVIEMLERLIHTQFYGLISGVHYEDNIQDWDQWDFFQSFLNFWNLQTTHSEHELALRPEHELSFGYVWLTYFPFPLTLPWDKWFAEAHYYLEYMGVPLYQLIETFIPAASNSFFSGYGIYRKSQLSSEHVVKALLKLPEPLYDLITKPFSGPDSVKTFFHLEDNLTLLLKLPSDSADEVKSFEVLMNRIGLWRSKEKGNDGSGDFKLIRRILGSRYIQDSRPSSDVVIDITFIGKSCDASNAEINNLTKDTILRIIKFEHLRRMLNWTPDELNL